MAANTVEVVGDTGQLLATTIDLSGPSEMSVISASFRGSPDERRVVSLFVDIGGIKTLELRFEFFDPAFITTTMLGKPLYSSDRF